MRLMHAALTLALAASLAACTSVEQSAAPPTPPAEDGACNADAAQSFVGKPASAAEQARAASGARTMRLIRPGQAVTMDYRPDRLNIELDASDSMVKLSCG
jgi:hypothetical protein